MIKAITFDVWDTILIDDSDEIKRKRAGLDSKLKSRLSLVQNHIKNKIGLNESKILKSWISNEDSFNRSWKNDHITWTVSERIKRFFNLVDCPFDDNARELVYELEEMELNYSPDFAPGIQSAISILQKKYKLGIISDTIYSPGRVLGQILMKEGIKEFFEAFVYSDEIGHSKPSIHVFNEAALQLKEPLSSIVHIGDREINDIQGAQAVGAKGILATVVKDRGSANTKADAIVRNYDNLLNIIESLN